MTRVALRVALQVVLVFGLGLPERSRRLDFGHGLVRPEAGRVDIRDGFFRDPLLLVADVEDGRPVAEPDVVSLTVLRRRIMDLVEELQQLPVADLLGIEHDLDGLGVSSVVAVRGVSHVTARVAHPGGDHTLVLADQILHTPKTATGQYGLLAGHCHVVTLLVKSNRPRWLAIPQSARQPRTSILPAGRHPTRTPRVGV